MKCVSESAKSNKSGNTCEFGQKYPPVNTSLSPGYERALQACLCANYALTGTKWPDNNLKGLKVQGKICETWPNRGGRFHFHLRFFSDMFSYGHFYDWCKILSYKVNSTFNSVQEDKGHWSVGQRTAFIAPNMRGEQNRHMVSGLRQIKIIKCDHPCYFVLKVIHYIYWVLNLGQKRNYHQACPFLLIIRLAKDCGKCFEINALFQLGPWSQFKYWGKIFPGEGLKRL